MKTRRVSFAAPGGVLAVALLAGGPVAAGPQQGFDNLLRGDYGLTGEAACLSSSDGFDPVDLTPAPAPSPFPSVRSFSVIGVMTFNGDGTGKRTVRVVSARHPSPPPSMNRGGGSSVDIEADFAYEVNPDRTVTIRTLSLTGNVLTGTRAGQKFTITGFPDFFGYLSSDHKTLTFAHAAPGVEVQAYSNGSTDIFERICHRSRTAVRLTGGGKGD